MNIGYACLTLGVQKADFRSCFMKNASDEKLIALIDHNLNSLENMINYNIRNQIRLFRISSDLIPFASSPVNTLLWQDLFKTRFEILGEKLEKAKMRVSMHPGQYTVLNSPDGSVVERAIADLVYHARVLDSLSVNEESKIVVHIGGIYGDKEKAMQRFEENWNRLDLMVKRRLVIENDDRSYSIADAILLGTKLGIPVIYDQLHHMVNSPVDTEGEHTKDDAFWIDEASKTWGKKDGRQKIHYSQQEQGKRRGSHSGTIHTDEFLMFYDRVKTKELDIMLEVKDKNLSAVKCINLISESKEIKALELEWSRYKYLVLERSPAVYQKIRTLLREKTGYPATAFYWLLEDAMSKDPEAGNAINAAQHIWGYFKDKASEQEKASFLTYTEECRLGKTDARKLKKILWKLTEKYQEPYLLNSFYFIDY